MRVRKRRSFSGACLNLSGRNGAQIDEVQQCSALPGPPRWQFNCGMAYFAKHTDMTFHFNISLLRALNHTIAAQHTLYNITYCISCALVHVPIALTYLLHLLTKPCHQCVAQFNQQTLPLGSSTWCRGCNAVFASSIWQGSSAEAPVTSASPRLAC